MDLDEVKAAFLNGYNYLTLNKHEVAICPHREREDSKEFISDCKRVNGADTVYYTCSIVEYIGFNSAKVR